ncbi:hypothetical protein Srufu_051340 [Streptomyces libani subsp. rufus]|nr:hypothetical protein Srufu_051340 [Streptomyces libani subsp. rufus]
MGQRYGVVVTVRREPVALPVGQHGSGAGEVGGVAVTMCGGPLGDLWRGQAEEAGNAPVQPVHVPRTQAVPGVPPPRAFFATLYFVGKRMYDLRHTCLTTWLNNDIPPAQVAARAGNSVPVLLATYTRCITGQLTELQGRTEEPQRLPAVSTAVNGPPKNFGSLREIQPPRAVQDRLQPDSHLRLQESFRPCPSRRAGPLNRP